MRKEGDPPVEAVSVRSCAQEVKSKLIILLPNSRGTHIYTTHINVHTHIIVPWPGCVLRGSSHGSRTEGTGSSHGGCL